uniref:Uncharacterized protein n=1 Tax=Rhizophora mucronata TaxID=61149 RepID=A0A2P2PC92_RHIMU
MAVRISSSLRNLQPRFLASPTSGA